ncbi:MAG TPA: hypothetical protein GX699_06510 [Firmicutes bacterium]|nr:hypothetical protein [Bacillota bacterium]
MQETFVHGQLQTLAVTVALGFFIGISYDVLSVFRQFVRLKRSLQTFLDFLYCFVMSITVFLVLLGQNWGEIRAYVFLGLGLGTLLYLLVLHRSCRLLLVKTAMLLCRLLRFLTAPLRRLTHQYNRFLAANRRFFAARFKQDKKKTNKKRLRLKFWRKKKE